MCERKFMGVVVKDFPKKPAKCVSDFPIKGSVAANVVFIFELYKVNSGLRLMTF